MRIKAIYKLADLYSDMAKRVLLSIVPSVMTPSERHHTGGFDFKALKSAVLGAKNLIKYGIKACVEELQHYAVEEHNPFTGNTDNNDEDKELLYANTKSLLQSGNYREALLVCIEAFSDKDNWYEGFGGNAWHKIATTLLELLDKHTLLERIRRENFSPERDPKIDYLEWETNTMKEIVVIMNVFDGLAHNTGSIMPKLIEEEAHDLKRDDVSDYERQVMLLMDAKELDDPVSVYKQVQDIMSLPENKHLFGDWINRIQHSQEFQQAKPKEEISLDLQKIRFKKKMKQYIVELSNDIEQLTSYAQEFMRASDHKQMFHIVHRMSQILAAIYETLGFIAYYKNDKAVDNSLAPIREHHMTLVNNFKRQLIKYESELRVDPNGKHSYSHTDMVSDIRKLSRMIAQIEMIASSI